MYKKILIIGIIMCLLCGCSDSSDIIDLNKRPLPTINKKTSIAKLRDELSEIPVDEKIKLYTNIDEVKTWDRTDVQFCVRLKEKADLVMVFNENKVPICQLFCKTDDNNKTDHDVYIYTGDKDIFGTSYGCVHFYALITNDNKTFRSDSAEILLN